MCNPLKIQCVTRNPLAGYIHGTGYPSTVPLLKMVQTRGPALYKTHNE